MNEIDQFLNCLAQFINDPRVAALYDKCYFNTWIGGSLSNVVVGDIKLGPAQCAYRLAMYVMNRISKEPWMDNLLNL